MTAEVQLPATSYVDSKRHLWPLPLLLSFLPVLGVQLADRTGILAFWFLSPFVFYGLVPLFDLTIRDDPGNPPESAVPALEADPYYRRLVIAYLPIQYGLFIWACWLMGTRDLGWIEWTGLTLTIGSMGAGGINAAHELGHKRDALARWVAKLMLAPVAYGHFFVEHVRGHHVRVATPEDPASARMGEGFYAFWPRTVLGSLRSAWRLERERLRRMGKGVLSPRNHNLQAWGLTVILWTSLVLAFGAGILPFLIVQAILGFSLLEVVNYLEHYGLLRQRLPDGRYEPCRPEHSWNSNHIVSNLFLYQLQRHSDHHAHAARSYQALRHFDEAPQLPSGYASMIMLAMCPPLWRRVMDHRLLTHYGGDPDRINLKPGMAKDKLEKDES